LYAEHKTTMTVYRERISCIFNQNIFGPIVIRDEVMKDITDCAPKSIDDCDVTAWTPEVCSVEDGNSCPHGVGGSRTQRLTREAVVNPNTCGFKGPSFRRDRE
jgi:hypothetical protein